MSAYFTYLWEMIKQVIHDIGIFFYDFIVTPWTKVGGNFAKYGEFFNAYSPDFGIWGWVMFGVFALLLSGVVFALLFGLFLLLRKYVRFVKKEIDKDKLKLQVQRLNYELYLIMKERDRILELKVKGLGVSGMKKPEELMGDGVSPEEAQEVIDEINSRFPKLAHVDNIYKKLDTEMIPIDGLSLKDISEAFRNFAASQLGLYYTLDTCRQVIAGMGAGKIIILEGISGTGKTSMPYALGKFFAHDAEICSVQPNWKDRTELLGYYNEFTKKFNESEFLRALYTVSYRKDMNIIVLDEMNLARVEYYFAEFLSILEMPNPNEWSIELIGSHDENDPRLIKENGKLKIPQNVCFFGTANNDESTFTISDKVYDRAICLFFDNKGIAFDAPMQAPMMIPYSQLQSLYDAAEETYPVSEETLAKFEQLDSFIISKFRLAFGNRILKQLKKFVPIYVACGGTELGGFDFIFTNKILKKFESLNVAFLKAELKELNAQIDKLFGKESFPMAHEFIDRLIKMA